MKGIIVLALVLVVFMFSATIATVTISTPEINTLDQSVSIEKYFTPCGDPIDGDGPPGAQTG